MFTVDQWSTCSQLNTAGNMYIPPEETGIAIQAKVSNRPGFENGITTTRVVKVNGRVVTTRSGTEYLLGKPDPDFVTWCKDRGLHDPSDPVNPLKVIHE